MPDFGIMRGFNEKLFGDKLVAGQLPTELGLIGSENFGFDVDAKAFFDRVTAAGGTLSATEKTAVDTLVKQMKLDGTWTPMKALYPLVGASAAACAQNLKSSSFTGTFSSGWTFASTGITCSGAAFMNTSLTPSNDLSLNNTHLSVYVRTNNAQSNPAIANTDNSSGQNELSIYPRYSGDSVYTRINASSGPITTSTNSQGMHIGSRIVSTQIKYYKNSSSFSLSNNSVSLTTGTMPLGALRYLGSIAGYYTGEFAFCSIGDGLTDTQALNFYTAVQAFQTTLSRNV
jgi:hypothetical protein